MKVPEVIPPGSTVRLVCYDDFTSDWKQDLGRTFRIGYYRKTDGLETIWLVNDDGEYEQTVDRDTLLKYFDLLSISRENDPFGRGRSPLRRKRRASV
jgi:hypothetical protein